MILEVVFGFKFMLFFVFFNCVGKIFGFIGFFIFFVIIKVDGGNNYIVYWFMFGIVFIGIVIFYFVDFD